MKLGKFLLGLGIGAAAGLLFAPKKGSEMREDLKSRSLDAYDKMKDMTKEDVEAILGETIENVKKSVDEFDADVFKASTKEKLDELTKKLEELAKDVQSSDEYSKVQEGVVEISKKLNTKIDDVKKKMKEQGIDLDSDKIEKEIDDVEEKLDEMIEEIKD